MEMYKIRPICEAIRNETLWLTNVQLERKNHVRDVKKIMRFPWEMRPKPQSIEEMKAKMEMIAAAFKKEEK